MVIGLLTRDFLVLQAVHASPIRRLLFVELEPDDATLSLAVQFASG
jgi:hypothetical protein